MWLMYSFPQYILDIQNINLYCKLAIEILRVDQIILAKKHHKIEYLKHNIVSHNNYTQSHNSIWVHMSISDIDVMSAT